MDTMQSRGNRLRLATTLAAIAALVILPFLARSQYQIHMVVVIGMNVILAVGLNLLMGFTGQINMGQYGFFAIGAYVSAVMSTMLHADFWLCMPAAVVVSGFFGFLVGFPALRVEGPYLALVTMGFAESVRIFLNNSDFFGMAMGISGIAAPRLFVPIDSPIRFYYFILGFLALSVVLNRNMIESSLGRKFRAIRDDPLAAEVIGISSKRIKILAFCICASFAGLSGSLYAHYNGYINPSIFSQGIQINFLLMIVLGGLGRKNGGLIGAVIVTIFYELTRQFVQYQMIAFGVLMIVVVLFFNKGITGFIAKFIESREAAANAEDGRDA